jgi:hypothetical protein
MGSITRRQFHGFTIPRKWLWENIETSENKLNLLSSATFSAKISGNKKTGNRKRIIPAFSVSWDASPKDKVIGK